MLIIEYIIINCVATGGVNIWQGNEVSFGYLKINLVLFKMSGIDCMKRSYFQEQKQNWW